MAIYYVIIDALEEFYVLFKTNKKYINKNKIYN